MTPTERAHVWQQHIADWEVSGVSGSAYCKQQSLVYHQFVYRRRKLAPTEDCLQQEQAATGFTRVVSAPGLRKPLKVATHRRDATRGFHCYSEAVVPVNFACRFRMDSPLRLIL
ncbi:IS66 family insertion sequence element accessory protein TnpA [Marinobacter sp. ELB17]|uniref:IS66 family insertion sequence element accessory protein TnpA n=1 Tax=Marinobacter sp. ELB17 TaxID=270374 RepID=UPI0039B3BD01